MSSEDVRHPWDTWLKRKRMKLKKGVHYNCQPHSMAQQVRNAAGKRGIKVSVLIEDTIVTVITGD